MSTEASQDTGGPEQERQKLDLPLRWSLVAVVVVAVLLALVTGFIQGAHSGFGVLVGGAVATINLLIFIYIVQGVLAGGRYGRLWILAAILKLGGLMGGAWLLMKTGICTGGQLAIGYVALPFGVVVGSLLAPQADDEHNGAGRDTD
jgi:hypothetical protein